MKLDNEKGKQLTFLGEDYFERLLEEIREIRLSERRFYQKITDICATSVDYNKDTPTTKVFFAKVQIEQSVVDNSRLLTVMSI